MAENTTGLFAKGLFGAPTAYTKTIELPVDALATLRGANEEQPRPGNPKYDALDASMREHGWIESGNYIMVYVNHLGEAWIAEGNNRVAVCARKGYGNLPTQVRWYNGGEATEGRWSPESVEAMATRQLAESATRSPPRVGYHVASSRHDLSITSDGLRPDNRGNIYVWDTIEMAQWFAGFHEDDDMTIWTVGLSGLNLIPDPETDDMREWSSEFDQDQNGGGWIVQGQDVGPERVDEY